MPAAPTAPRASSVRADVNLPPGDAVPTLVDRTDHPRSLLTPAARRAVRLRMLLLRQAALDRILGLTGVSPAELQQFRRELRESDLADTLIQRGAGMAFPEELPQGALLYLLVRAARPRRVLETGVRPGYSTAWILAALERNGSGALTSLGPGPTAGRSRGVHDYGVGQLVPPTLRSHWTLALGNTEDRLRELVTGLKPIDLFFSDNGPDVARARSELRMAWESLGPSGLLVAHHIDANAAWSDFCTLQGLAPQVLDPGPPPMGALSVRAVPPR